MRVIELTRGYDAFPGPLLVVPFVVSHALHNHEFAFASDMLVCRKSSCMILVVSGLSQTRSVWTKISEGNLRMRNILGWLFSSLPVVILAPTNGQSYSNWLLPHVPYITLALACNSKVIDCFEKFEPHYHNVAISIPEDMCYISWELCLSSTYFVKDLNL